MDARKHAADQASRTIQLAYQAQSAAQQAAQSAQAAQSILTAAQDGFASVSQGSISQQPFVPGTQPWQ